MKAKYLAKRDGEWIEETIDTDNLENDSDGEWTSVLLLLYVIETAGCTIKKFKTI